MASLCLSHDLIQKVCNFLDHALTAAGELILNKGLRRLCSPRAVCCLDDIGPPPVDAATKQTKRFASNRRTKNIPARTISATPAQEAARSRASVTWGVNLRGSGAIPMRRISLSCCA